ncbi:metal ABC transporter permease [Candidatus Sumerlaeota bacterium]|nr:metal ABC transporter permease [Candidatus Sumerlaeota bacterium]
MVEMLQSPFMQRALAAGVMVGLLGSFYGVFVVQRGLSFLGDGLAHAAFGGVALGLLLGCEPLWIALPATALVAAGIVWVQQKTKLGGDTTIGIFFAVSMALGIIFLSMRREFTTDAFAYLFGSILAVTPADLRFCMVAVVLSLCTWPFWGRWAYATFDRELAVADRIHAAREDYFLSISVALTVVVSVKIVGVVLIASFLVIPAASARLLARTFFGMTVISVMAGVMSVVAGLWISYLADIPSGATVILLQAFLFFAAVMLRRPSV